jgi:hypothetical protein
MPLSFPTTERRRKLVRRLAAQPTRPITYRPDSPIEAAGPGGPARRRGAAPLFPQDPMPGKTMWHLGLQGLLCLDSSRRAFPAASSKNAPTNRGMAGRRPAPPCPDKVLRARSMAPTISSAMRPSLASTPPSISDGTARCAAPCPSAIASARMLGSSAQTSIAVAFGRCCYRATVQNVRDRWPKASAPMTGSRRPCDGVNDAASLAQADLGIALGSGADIAMQAAPLVLMNHSLASVVETLDLSSRTFNIVRQNLFWAFTYNVCGITLAISGTLSSIFAAPATVLPSISVLGNSLRSRC